MFGKSRTGVAISWDVPCRVIEETSGIVESMAQYQSFVYLSEASGSWNVQFSRFTTAADRFCLGFYTRSHMQGTSYLTVVCFVLHGAEERDDAPPTTKNIRNGNASKLLDLANSPT